jgi:aromatic-L-amino-acid decarboxylase
VKIATTSGHETGWSRVAAPGAANEVNRLVLERVNASGVVFLSHAVLRGRYALRLAVGQMNTSIEDMELAWSVLRREAAAVI